MDNVNELKAKVKMFENFFDKICETMTEEQIAERDKAIDEYDRIEREEFAFNRFKNCGLGCEYWNCSLDSFNCDIPEQSKMKMAASQFCDFVKNGTVKNLVLTGDCGTGKTHIAAAILREFAGNIKAYAYDQPIYSKIRYATVSDISNELRDADSFSNNKSRTSVFNSFKEYDIFVIDEVGRNINKFENESDLLFGVIDARYQAGKSTIFITNESKKDFFELLGKASTSRISAFNRLMFLEIKNIPDQRRVFLA